MISFIGPPFTCRIISLNISPLSYLASYSQISYIRERAFEMLKLALIEAPILQSPNWDLPFEIMCDASDYAVRVVLGHQIDKKPTAIWYASKTLAEAQMNYTTM